MKYIKQILVLFVSITVLNVWLIRFNNATIFRGGDAANMLEEFIVYGFDKSFLYLIGALKISAALGLIIGLFYKKLIVPCALIIGVLMGLLLCISGFLTRSINFSLQGWCFYVVSQLFLFLRKKPILQANFLIIN